jgi:tRNA wybutosine-synthesizing protein 1
VPPPKAQKAFKTLYEDSWTSTSFARLRYTVFGLGNSVYGANFCKAARDLDARLLTLGAQRVCARGENDDDHYRPEVYAKWKDLLWMAHGARVMGNSVQFIENPSDGESDDSASAEEWDSDQDEEEEEADFLEAALPTTATGACGDSSSALQDLEDLGSVVAANRKGKKANGQVQVAGKPKKMLNPSLEASLTKQVCYFASPCLL